jgi:hypothetical protein
VRRLQASGFRLQVEKQRADYPGYARLYAGQGVGEESPADSSSLQSHSVISQGRTIWPEESDTSVLCICSSQHLRGLWQGHKRRSGPLPPDSSGLCQRASVPSYPRPRPLVPESSRPRTPDPGSDRDKAHAYVLHREPQKLRQPDLKPETCCLKPYSKVDA